MSNQKQSSNELLKLLGVGFGIAVTIGGTIGTGILRKPGPIAAQLQDPSLIMLAWGIVSIYAFLGVLCVIELGVSLPKAGAWYVYAHRAFGNYYGFITGLSSWLGTVSALAFSAYTMSEYMALLLPNLENHIRPIAALLLFILMIFHLTGTKSAGKSQEIMSFLKSIGLLAFVILCFVYGSDVRTEHLIATTQEIEKPMIFVGFITALQSIFYAYDGWHTAAYFAEENTDPAKNLPKSMIGGSLMVIAIYLLVNWAILYILPMNILANSKLAAADAMNLIFGENSAKVITFFLMVSILGMANAQIMFAPRGIYSMGRDGLFWKGVTKVNKVGTPYIAMSITAIGSILLIINGKETCAKLSDIATFFFVMGYTSAFASLIKLRISEPDLPRPYKAWGFPIVPIVLIIASLLFLIGAVYQDIESSKYALIFLLFSYPLYRLISYINSASK